MKMRFPKLFLTGFWLFICLGLLPIHCCPDIDPYWRIGEMSSAIPALSEGSDTLRTNILEVEVDLVHEFFSDVHHQGFSFFQPSAMATSCEGDGERGMKDPINTIVISSDAEYDGRPANTSLNDLAIWFNNEEERTIQELIDISFSETSFAFRTSYVLRLQQKPNNEQPHRFKVTMTTVDGEVFSAETLPVVWL